MKSPKPDLDPYGKRPRERFLSVFLLLLMVLSSALAWRAETPPATASPDAGGFSAVRVMRTLHYLLDGEHPHPTGTVQNGAMRHRIVLALQQLGYAPKEEVAFVCDDEGSCADVHNIIVAIPGTLGAPGVLLDAHYDSVGAGPGAADNACDVAAALEIAGLLKAEAKPLHDVYLLIDDGEEQGLLGSRAFIQHSSFASRIRWAVNLDARGVRGPSLMFETSADNTALMHLYAHAVSRPVANSLMYSLYEHLPSETDFTNLRAAGMQGFNLAFLGGTTFYHRAGDTMDHLDPKSLQHQGDAAWALVQALAASPPNPRASGNAVYFDLFRYMVEWPRHLTPYLLLFTAFALIITLANDGSRKHLWPSVAWGVGTTLLTALVAGGLSFGALQALYPGAMLPPRFVAHPGPYVIAALALAVAVASWLSSLAASRVHPWEFLVGCWIFWTVAGAAIDAESFGASYLFVVPSLLAAVTLALAATLMKGRKALLPVALLTALAPAVLWMPLLRILFQGLGLLSLVLTCCLVASLLGVLLIPMGSKPTILRRTACVSVVVSIVAAAAGLLAPSYSSDVPFPLNLAYVQGEKDPPHWILATRPVDLKYLRSMLTRAKFTLQPHPEALVPWFNSQSASMYATPAQPLPDPLPTFQIIERQSVSDDVCTTGLISAPQNADKVLLNFSPHVILHSMAINGLELSPLPQSYLAAHGGWARFATTNRATGVAVHFCLDKRGAQQVDLLSESYGLPQGGAALVNTEPRFSMPSQDGDITIRVRCVPLTSPSETDCQAH